MREIVFIIISYFIHLYSFSQSDTTISLIPNWKKGDIKKYEIKNYSSADAEDEKKINGLTTKTVIIQVVDVNDKLLELNWKIEQLNFSDTINSDNPFSELMNTLDKDISVRYSISNKGNIISVLNLDEISKTIKSRVDVALKDFIEKNNIEKSQADRLGFQFSMMFYSDEQIKTIVLSDIFKFHQIYGYLFSPNKTTIIPDNIFAPDASGQPSNNLELKCTDFNKKDKIYFIEGELKCAETDERMREFIGKDRIIKNTYKFKYPENWLISYKSIMNAGGEYVSVNTSYEINLIE
jgi:hypothetical protein